MNTIKLVLIIIFAFALIAPGQSKIEAFDSYVEASRVAWSVPGMSVAVVQDGKVLLSKGYGIRELGKSEKVDSQTLFGCMSTTKAMTAVALGMLVDEGKVAWDDKVTKHLPGFRVDDRYVTGDIRIRDLLTHNTGIGNTDFLWALTPELSPSDIVRRMQYAKNEYPLRGGFVYQNIMYLVAGQVIEKTSGMPWEDFMAKRLFAPLGMTNTYANPTLSLGYSNRSAPHYEIKGKIQPIPELIADPVGPAGSVWSTSDDIAKWINFMLGNTTVGGKELLKMATYKEMLRPQVVIPPGAFYPTEKLTKPHWTTYSLGWFQHDYRGEMVSFHTGSLDGRTAIIGLIPDKKLGIYIFGNLDHAEVRHALMYRALDVFGFGDNSRDWSTEAKAIYDGLAADGKKRVSELKAKRKLNTNPSLPLASYIGKYADPFYGEMEVVLAGNVLKMNVSRDLSATLDHWHFDTFMGTWNKPWWDEEAIVFRLNAVTGEVESLDVGGLVYKKMPSAK